MPSRTENRQSELTKPAHLTPLLMLFWTIQKNIQPPVAAATCGPSTDTMTAHPVDTLDTEGQNKDTGECMSNEKKFLVQGIRDEQLDPSLVSG